MTKKIMVWRRPLAGVFLLIIATLALSGCSNTFEGVGRDIEHAGQKIQKTF